jgi:hypothetical protein
VCADSGVKNDVTNKDLTQGEIFCTISRNRPRKLAERFGQLRLSVAKNRTFEK